MDYNHVCCADGNLILPYDYDTQQVAHCENAEYKGSNQKHC
jgi:hypothetical protein